MKKFCLPVLLIAALFLIPCLLQAQETGYAGPKKRIAVAGFETKAPGADGKIGDGMSEMLVTALHETGRFIVVERQNLDNVLREQDLGASGRIRGSTAAKVGELVGAQIFISGAVTEFEERESGGGIGGVFRGFAVGVGVVNAHVAIDLRMYDTSTGVILESHRSEAKASSVGLTGGTVIKGVAIGAAGFKKTPLGVATRQAIEDAVAFIINKMESLPWQGRIITVKADKIYVNAGSNSGMSGGESFDVYHVGEELIDPETGLSLGTEEAKIGAIEITQVKEKFSIARIIIGTGFTRGDIVRMREKKVIDK